MKDFDWLFELTEYSENEGEQILVECPTLEEAYKTLIQKHDFHPDEIRFIECMSVEEGEFLGLDTY